jgi:hypothetical protein
MLLMAPVCSRFAFAAQAAKINPTHVQKTVEGGPYKPLSKAELVKLKPLTVMNEDERAIYESIMNNPAELKKFIATRAYMRTVDKALGPGWRDLSAVPKSDTDRLPAMSKAVTMDYAISLQEQLIIYAKILPAIFNGTYTPTK